MLLGSYHIYECPTCKTKYKKMTLRSGNNFGGEFWSDSKQIYQCVQILLLLVNVIIVQVFFG